MRRSVPLSYYYYWWKDSRNFVVYATFKPDKSWGYCPTSGTYPLLPPLPAPRSSGYDDDNGSLHVSIPTVKRFSAENFPSPVKTSPQNGVFSLKMGSNHYISVSRPHILARNRVFWRILRGDQCSGLGCSFAEEPKKETK